MRFLLLSFFILVLHITIINTYAADNKTVATSIINNISIDSRAQINLEEIYNKIKPFRGLAINANNLQQLLDKKILSAQLLVKFTKPRKMEEEDYEKLLGAYMKPIGDDEGVTFKLKNGKSVKGTNILRTKDVEIEMIDEVRISENDLAQEMESFLRELNNEL